ncbi:MAG: hypothetical protein K6G64_09315 [Eubacterium sp.]|nr:hypothetical protein [Eubacterium sp.]
MKKQWISGFLVAVIIITTVFSNTKMIIADNSYDITKPVLNSIIVNDPMNLDGDGKMNLCLDITEDGSGVTLINIKLVGVHTKNSFYVSYSSNVDSNLDFYSAPLFSGENNISVNIYDAYNPHAVLLDEYFIDEIQLMDANGNKSFYTLSEGGSWMNKSTTKIRIIHSSHTDITAPVIKSFSVENANQIDATKGYINVTLDLIENGSGLARFSFGFQGDDGKTIYLDWSNYGIKSDSLKSGKNKIKLEISKYVKPGKYQLCSLEARDNEGNVLWLTEEHAELYNSKYTQSIEIIKSLYVDNFVKINKIEVISKKVVTPDLFKLKMDLETGKGGIRGIFLKLMDDHGNTKLLTWDSDKSIRSGTYIFQFPVSAYSVDGNYKIRSITFFDEYGTDAITHYYGENPKSSLGESLLDVPDFSNPTIQIKSAFDISYYGSTANIAGALQAINKMKNGQVAVLDYRNYYYADKKLFEAIAGADKTIVFQDSDVQWVFHGTDIKKKQCKTINLHVDISKEKGADFGYADDPYILLMCFAKNGKLPGKVRMRINDEYLKQKYKVNNQMILSYFDKSAEVLDKNVKCSKDGYMEFSIKHNSKYILSDKMPRLLAPLCFKAKRFGKSAVKLSWGRVAGATGYTIYRASKKNGKMKRIKIVKSGRTLKYKDYNVKKGKRYYYRIKGNGYNKKIKAIYSRKISVKIKK